VSGKNGVHDFSWNMIERTNLGELGIISTCFLNKYIVRVYWI